jgi:protein arginine kinase
MSLENFMSDAISPWMKENGPDCDIVMSSRIRLARNFENRSFPLIAKAEELDDVLEFFQENYQDTAFDQQGALQFIRIADLSPIEKKVLVEKHLISPHLTEHAEEAGVLLSESEQVSIMVNEEDHLRIQLYLPGFQLQKALNEAFKVDDWLEQKITYAFDEERGYLTTCPTNVGTGLRASVMMHLPALTMTHQMNRLTPAINQLGLVVRGIYGEGSEAQGNIYQISNQITLGKSEQDIVEDLESVVSQLIEQERQARETLTEELSIQLEDRIFRSYGTLRYSRIIESKEAATCLSDVRLGIDLGYIEDMPQSILNELMVLIQPGFLQRYAKRSLSGRERDVLRASLIRERMHLENN